MGKVGGDVPGIGEGASWLARDIAATLCREDIEAHWESFRAYDEPALQGGEWSAGEPPARDDGHVPGRRASGRR